MTTMTTEHAVVLKQVDLGQAGLWGLQDITEKLNRRAERYGMEKLVVTILDEWTVRNEDNGREERKFRVEIAGRAPRINGWQLAARIENNETIGTMVRVVPGKYDGGDYSKYRDHDFACDHCNTRRRRNDVFVLKHSDGSTKVVGRNCLADFLRCKDAAGFAEYAEWFDKIDGMSAGSLEDHGYDEGFGGREAAAAEPVVSYLAVARMITRRIGWMSRTAARDSYDGATSTADNTNFYLYGRGRAHTLFIRENELEVSDADVDYAKKAVEWAASLSPEQTAKSEYLDVISRIAKVGLVGEGLDGYAASIGRAWEKDCEWKAERAEKEAQKENAPEKVYVGSVGERLKGLVVTVKRVRYFEGHYGVTTIVAMEHKLSDGTVAPITWFASGERDYNEGEDYTFTGTVKSHDSDDRYGKQTKVNRCKLTEL